MDRWLSTAEAADELGVTPTSVIRFVRAGAVDGRLLGRTWWVTASSVEALRASRDRWVSRKEAARLAGCSATTIGEAAGRGEIVSRELAGRFWPALDRVSVEAWAEQRAAREAARARAQAPRRPVTGPPDDGDVWLDAETAALVLGFTREWVRKMARREQLPAVRRGQQWWFRRRDVEQAAAARALRVQWGRGSS